MELEEVLKKRRSVRCFLEKEVEKEKLEKILEAARSAPSAGNLEAREVYIISDKKKKGEIATAALNQSFIQKAPLVLIFFADLERSASKYGERGKELYAIQDATIAASFAWLEAVAQGLASVWVGAFDDEEIKKNLGAEDNLKPIAILPIGYGAEGPAPTSRRPKNETIKKFS